MHMPVAPRCRGIASHLVLPLCTCCHWLLRFLAHPHIAPTLNSVPHHPPSLKQVVWAVLTDYNRLAEFIPNLAVSQRIALPPNAPPNVIRVRQVRLTGCGGRVRVRRLDGVLTHGMMALAVGAVSISQPPSPPIPTPSPAAQSPPQVGYKRMLYMCLHAESVLDLIEKPQT